MSDKRSNGGLLSRVRYGGLVEAGQRHWPTGESDPDRTVCPPDPSDRYLGGESWAMRLSHEYRLALSRDDDCESSDFFKLFDN
jgi:hypothetical protein